MSVAYHNSAYWEIVLCYITLAIGGMLTFNVLVCVLWLNDEHIISARKTGNSVGFIYYLKKITNIHTKNRKSISGCGGAIAGCGGAIAGQGGLKLEYSNPFKTVTVHKRRTLSIIVFPFLPSPWLIGANAVSQLICLLQHCPLLLVAPITLPLSHHVH